MPRRHRYSAVCDRFISLDFLLASLAELGRFADSQAPNNENASTAPAPSVQDNILLFAVTAFAMSCCSSGSLRGPAFGWSAVSPLALAASLSGLVGIVIYSVLAQQDQPIMQNLWIPMWAAAMVLWSGLELLSNNIKTPSHQSRFGFVLGLFYFGFCTVLAILAGMGWSVASRVDILGWFLLAAILSLVSMVISVQSQPMKASESESKNEEEESIMPGDASEPDGRQPGDQNHRTCANRLLRVLCVFMKLFHISFLALLANGGIQAAINHSYPPRGTISILRLADNRTQQIHHFCLGNSSLPTFFLDSSAAHGTVDFYPLQQHLANLGRRVCVHDPPAFGWSGDLLDGEYYYPQAAGTGSLYYDALFEAMGEANKQLILVGWGGGGSPVLRYASKRPERVAAVGLLDVYPDGIEFRTEQARRNLSREETLGYIDQQLQSRLALANMVNSLAIPWGLMDVLVPAGNGTGYVPLEYYSSYRAQLKKANGVFDGEEFDLIADPVACHPLLEAWVGQYWGIRDMERTAPIISFSSHGYNDLQSLDPITLDSSIPVFHILSNLTAEQVCLGPFLKTNPAECAKAVFANEVSINGKIRATEQLGNGTVVFGYCNFDGCGLGFPFERAEWTAGEIVKALNVIGF